MKSSSPATTRAGHSIRLSSGRRSTDWYSPPSHAFRPPGRPSSSRSSRPAAPLPQACENPLPIARSHHNAASVHRGGPPASAQRPPASPRSPWSDPGRLVLQQEGGGGNALSHPQDFWVHPLPPPGPVTLVVSWPEHGLTEARAELDGAAIGEAAQRAVTLWPDEPGTL